MRNVFTQIIIGMFSFCLTAQTTSTTDKASILILIHSNEGGTYELAKEVAQGVIDEGQEAVIKMVQKSKNEKLKNIPIASVEDLLNNDGIAIGSPVYFGGMSTEMSAFWAKTVGIWQNHSLEGKPVTVFMSAGSGAGKELAIQSIWNTVAVHGMTILSSGIRGTSNIDLNIPQGNTVLGTTSLASNKVTSRPSDGERLLARLQGAQLAKVSVRLQGLNDSKISKVESKPKESFTARFKELGYDLPETPKPAGNYKPFVRSGNLIYINQVALKNGSILFPGKIESDLSIEEAQEATKQTMLNVLAVLRDAVDDDMDKVVQCVQLSGFFNTDNGFTKHAVLMNSASDLLVTVFGEKGKHARGTFGVNSLPVNSAVEIQAIFEIR